MGKGSIDGLKALPCLAPASKQPATTKRPIMVITSRVRPSPSLPFTRTHTDTCPPPPPPTHTPTYTHTHIPTHRHTHTYTPTPIYPHTHTHTYIHTHTFTHPPTGLAVEEGLLHDLPVVPRLVLDAPAFIRAFRGGGMYQGGSVGWVYMLCINMCVGRVSGYNRGRSTANIHKHRRLRASVT